MNLAIAQNVAVCHGCVSATPGANVCPADGGKIGAHAEAGDCPRGLYRSKVTPVVAVAESRQAIFHALWREIHGQTNPTDRWLKTVLARLPCGECRREAKAYLANNPPPLDDSAAWPAYACRWHNAVNVRLGKPVIDDPGTSRGSLAEPAVRPQATGG